MSGLLWHVSLPPSQSADGRLLLDYSDSQHGCMLSPQFFPFHFDFSEMTPDSLCSTDALHAPASCVTTSGSPLLSLWGYTHSSGIAGLS